MVQVFIIRKDAVSPIQAVQTGQDASICGNCKHRGVIGERTCYVDVGKSVQQVWRTYRARKYKNFEARDGKYFNGRSIRIGAYGDPAAVPPAVWQYITSLPGVTGWTGYTHQWRESRHQLLKGLVQASVDSQEEADEAQALGWKTFRVKRKEEKKAASEAMCLASDEYNEKSGRKTTCDRCQICDGSRANVVIDGHGMNWNRIEARKRVALPVL